MIKRIWVEPVKTAPEENKSVLYIEFADGTFVANEMDHSLGKERLAKVIGEFAGFIHKEGKAEKNSRYENIIKKLDKTTKLKICNANSCACNGCCGIVGAKKITQRELELYMSGTMQKIVANLVTQ